MSEIITLGKKKAVIGLIAAVLMVLGGGLYVQHRKVSIGNPAPAFRTKGAAAPVIRITKFSDFACPACAKGSEALERLVLAYPDKVQVQFKHNPLTGIHKWSYDAALYADCAGRQGKFWEYSKLLFAGMDKWRNAGDLPAEFAAYAHESGLDSAVLNACRNDPAAAAALRGDLADGERLGINTTPTFLVNGERAVGVEQLAVQLRKLSPLLKEAAR